MYRMPTIPEYIIVHLGAPSENARNIRVPFIEYIKNVASGEIYPNWPKEAIKANVLAIISFALNRIYNEWYPSRGYNFDITSSSQYDQSFQEDRQFFESIYVVVDEIFNSYIVRNGQVQPLFAGYCDGRKTTCSGLSQWGSVSLANQGLSALNILKKYYGNNITIVENAKTSALSSSYPGYTLKPGDAGDDIRIIKKQLNRIGQNYPAIPPIITDTVYFDKELENAVKVFQNTFTLPVNGEINKATWYKIKYLYNAVKNISSLYSEGISMSDVELKYPEELKLNDQGSYVKELHYYLNMIACFDNSIPNVNMEGDIYNTKTLENVKAFQRKYNLEVSGIVDNNTWVKIRDVYKNYVIKIPNRCVQSINEFFSGRYLSRGMTGEDVLNLQRFLFLICSYTHEIPGVVVSGEYDYLTERSVKQLQEKFSIDNTGVVNTITWKKIVEYEKNII